jgi:outer membrane protein OmpA-like peptidoglycan-associated protein
VRARPDWILAMLSGLLAWAAPPPARADSPKVQLYEEVEKGLVVGGRAGFAWDFLVPIDEPGPGLQLGLELGYDVLDVLRVKVGYLDTFYTGRTANRRGDPIKVDYEHGLVYAGASLALFTTQRLYLYLQAGLGYQFTDPKQVDGVDVAGRDDLAILAGGGLEYYTALRHFSFGLEAEVTYLPIRGDVALAIYPVIRFTWGFAEVREVKPPEDRDFDGVPDDRDRCPDVWGPEWNQGCPEPDRDGDGVVDREDRCPDEPGPKDNAGCPRARDRDGDGIPDDQDRCPDEPGPRENEGCPELDSDGDGIPDKVDLCPDRKGFREFEGCPKKSDIKIRLSKKAIELRESIHFEVNKDVIKRESFALLDQVAATLTQYPEIKKLEIQGHTDSQGPDDYNQRLSQRRAQAVVNYLVNKGVDSSRLQAIGHGESKPIDTNATAAGRAVNRRVEMIILERE